MRAGEFPEPERQTERPLVAGALTGVRHFIVDEYGRLTGVMLPRVWAPGANTAECLCGTTAITWQPQRDITNNPAAVATLGHDCGFYGYTSPSYNDPRNPDPWAPDTLRFWAADGPYSQPTGASTAQIAAGVVKAWGTVTAGPLGFRAKHAAVVAITPIPGPRRGSSATREVLTTVVQRNYPCVRVFDDIWPAWLYGQQAPTPGFETPHPRFVNPPVAMRPRAEQLDLPSGVVVFTNPVRFSPTVITTLSARLRCSDPRCVMCYPPGEEDSDDRS